MLSMKVSTLRCSYLNKSNRVGLVPRGLHYGTTAVRKRKSWREDRIFKVGVKKASGRGSRAFDIFHGQRQRERGVRSPRPGKGLVLCYMEILRASCFRDKKPRVIRPVTRYQGRRFNIYPQMEGSERGKERVSGNKLNSFAS